MAGTQSLARRAVSPPRRQRACQPCSKAKARCNFPDNNDPSDGCDRCRRVKIQCIPQTTKVLRRPRQLKTKESSPSLHHQSVASLPDESLYNFLPSDTENSLSDDSHFGSPTPISTSTYHSGGSAQTTSASSYSQGAFISRPTGFSASSTLSFGDPQRFYSAHNVSMPMEHNLNWTQATYTTTPFTSRPRPGAYFLPASYGVDSYQNFRKCPHHNLISTLNWPARRPDHQ
ncbi:hypothetical protein BKA67DRAFT_301925 [Truncatella angustata]|uniref:Zn(2)-C6 fungal-type domain-containing protein n=1 Tax=Truncatella angustata TaxID=152316 RepID=A0A9P8UIJ2_9PEZI|nr:uncharacterized protein BKA67DRAFT_301925 [Truncatella angustata]KAH6652826.1 hypothetical protein BKA67DRAFT_301925 [Truncatella angustata]